MLQNKIRIIGGKWRGRRLSFPDVDGLRPTPNRIRETLFNWVAQDIEGACCLDLFAGSGALGFEALSRGAREVVFVDQDAKVIACLKENQRILECRQMEIYGMDAERYLAQTDQKFDLVFLDPPFHKKLIEPLCRRIAQQKILRPGAHVYVETEANLKEIDFPAGWKILKHKQAGQVQYFLLKA